MVVRLCIMFMLLPYSSITQHVLDFLSTFLLSFQDSLAISDYQKFWCKLVYMEHNHINAGRCLVKRYKWAQEYARLFLSWKDGQELWACMVSKREFTKSNWSGKQSHMYRELLALENVNSCQNRRDSIDCLRNINS